MAPIATVTGTAIRPGISKNNRLYTAEAIGKAVQRAQARIAEGGMPLTTLTHHGADDDSTRIVGRITSLTHEADGSARYTAVVADTTHGRDIHGLISGPDPVLKGVSIRGAWLGPVRRVQHDGRMVETADDLELDGLDYTRKPGVEGAGIESVDPVPAQPRESDGTVRVLITESAPEATVTISEAEPAAKSKAPYGDVTYADPGYQKDKQKRYPLDTKARAKSAWSYINQADNARLYTSAQLKRVKQRIVKALKAFGVTVATQEGWLVEPAAQLTEALAECWDMPMSNSNLYVSLTNGPTTVTVSSTLLDAHDLDAVGRAAMAGAVNAVLTLDPDLDADIDVPGADDEDTDKDQHEDEEPDMADDDNPPGSACSCGCGCAVPHPMAVGGGCPCGCGCTTCKAPDADAAESAPTSDAASTQTPAPDPAAETTTEREAAMAESTPATDSGVADLSAKFDTLIGAINGMVSAMAPVPVEAAPADPAPVAEAAPVVQETQEQMIARLVAEGVAKALPQAVQETVERQGPPSRKGYVAQVAESAPEGGADAGPNRSGVASDWPDKPLHEYSPDERNKFFGPALRQHVLQDRFRG